MMPPIISSSRSSGRAAAGVLASRGTAQDLQNALQRLEGKSYMAYHDVEGAWAFQNFTFILDRAQSDPFAAASRCPCACALMWRMYTFACHPKCLLYDGSGAWHAD